MAVVPEYVSSVFREVIEFLATSPSAEAIIAYKPSDALQQRMSYLLERNRGVGMTHTEQDELHEFLRLNQFMNLLQARTQEKLLEHDHLR
jgi:hypothetical protein